MALNISIETDYGVPATYWNIGAVQEDFKGKGTEVTIYGYSDKDSYEDGKQPLTARKFLITGDEYIAGADRAALYGLIAAKPEFEDAKNA